MRSAFEMRSRWWTGSAQITTFSLEELLGTKLRALFQRKKGRDLYDVWYALKGGANAEKVVTCFARYMRESGRTVSRAEFEQNLAGTDRKIVTAYAWLPEEQRQHGVGSGWLRHPALVGGADQQVGR